MDSTYRSLDPQYQERLSYFDRKQMVKARLRLATGEPFGTTIGTFFGIGNALIAYHYFATTSGFKFFPFKQSSAGVYGGIIGAGLVGLALGKAYAAGVMGDRETASYIRSHKSEILNGTAACDPTE